MFMMVREKKKRENMNGLITSKDEMCEMEQ